MSSTDNAGASAQKLPNSKYTEASLTDELFREVVFHDGRVYRIDDPVALIIREGGKTHRVVDSAGIVHCYAAPETGQTVIRWKSREGRKPVAF